MTYQDIPGWFDFEDVYRRAVAEAPQVAHFVEVGCWLGKSTAFLAQQIKDSGKRIMLFAVDTWAGSPGEDSERLAQQMGGADAVCEKFRQNVAPFGLFDFVWPLKMDSIVAGGCFSPFQDFVFLDAAHSYEAVSADLAAWWPKVQIGGLFGGHDYTANYVDDVMRAVDEFFPEGVERVGSSWLVRKREQNVQACQGIQA